MPERAEKQAIIDKKQIDMSVEPTSVASEAEVYKQFEDKVAGGDQRQALLDLCEHLKTQKRYHEVFEAKKMLIRSELGLAPAQADQEDRAEEETELKLERGLLEACREVGELFFADGLIREGWMYLRPVGDRNIARAAVAKVEPNDDNVDALLEVLVHEAVDVRRGYSLALERLGTCNSITLFESALAARPRSDQQDAAELLVKHVHAELLENVRRDIERREGALPKEETLEELLSPRSELLAEGAYHLDTSHLASTVRFARVLDDKKTLELVLDIAKYGRRLHRQYQYPGEEPFLDLYPASIAFFEALLDRNVDSGIRYFQQKADSVSQQEYGTVAVEVLIDLLSRCGRHADALEAFRKRLPADARTVGIAPTLLQLSQRMGDYTAMKQISKDRSDVLGFAAALLNANS